MGPRMDRILFFVADREQASGHGQTRLACRTKTPASLAVQGWGAVETMGTQAVVNYQPTRPQRRL